MMKFRIEVEPQEIPTKLSYSSKALFIGSCFTSNIGGYLQRYKFKVDVNPFGVIYNPASIINSLNLMLEGKVFNEEDLCYQNGLWFSYAHHSSFSLPDKAECLAQINNRLQQSSKFLQQADFLFITLGTAYAYKLKQTNEITSNCHKTPAKEFERILLSSGQIINSFSNLINQLTTINPKIKIIFSISPIRHIKDGAHGNQISKANILLAVNELQKYFTATCFYFPAYELLIDDLRDYRFYADDMCHPSNQAIEYIWEKFQDCAIDKSCKKLMKQIEDVTAACAHRPFNANTAQHKAFQQKYINIIEQLNKQYPIMDFTNERQLLNQ